MPRPSKGCFLEAFEYLKTTNKHPKRRVLVHNTSISLISFDRGQKKMLRWWTSTSRLQQEGTPLLPSSILLVWLPAFLGCFMNGFNSRSLSDFGTFFFFGGG